VAVPGSQISGLTAGPTAPGPLSPIAAMPANDRVFDITVHVFYAETRLRQLRKMPLEAFIRAVQQDLTLIGLMRPKRENTELVDDGVRLTWTVLERNRSNVCTEYSVLDCRFPC
jgi:hypothetical protein